MKREVVDIAIELIDEPELASRVLIDTARLEELAESIKLKGVIVPLHVKEVPASAATQWGDCDGVPSLTGKPSPLRYRVIAGHRRLLASPIPFLHTSPCLVYPPAH